MPLMSWRPEFSVGVMEIDSQHKMLIDIINHLHEAMTLGGKPQLMLKAFAELVEYTRLHFSAEEKLMQSWGYPQLEEHKRKHRAMVAHIEGYRAGLESGSAATSMKLMTFVKEWLSRHILETDQGYRPFVKQVA